MTSNTNISNSQKKNVILVTAVRQRHETTDKRKRRTEAAELRTKAFSRINVISKNKQILKHYRNLCR